MATASTPIQGQLQNQFEFLNHVKYEHLIAGLSGGLVSTLCLHPLDVIKIRFAVHDGHTELTPKYSGITNAFTTIYSKEGLRGFYRGCTPNCVGAASSWGLYFLFYNAIKTFVQKGNIQMPLSPAQHLLAATQAGAFTLLITNPIWVVKTRLCLQYSYMDTNGFRGYYKGFVPGLFGVSHGAIQFMVYEEMKNQYNKYKGTNITTKLATIEYLTFAAISKLIAAATTYPYQVVRARLQNQHYSYKGAMDCVSRTWLYEGWRGFYKGLGTNLLRVTPATMITFLTYENVAHLLLQQSRELQAG
ncbi:hypothetical protein Trydic_g6638 [Trypoxylus dichotomus]